MITSLEFEEARIVRQRRYCRNVRAVLLMAVALLVLPAFGDGCFVFRWDKKSDINEPAQKAILVWDAGREDLLLQVKYEGALEDFGWLIPVPSLPKVTKGSMQPFYELSQLTQRQFGTEGTRGTLGVVRAGGAEEVKVIEVKTVGAYEVSILSASEAGSLERWLRAHGYSIPEGKGSIIDEYIKRNWYFIAARIQLEGETALKVVSSTSPKDPDAMVTGRRAVQKQLSSGELHPLLISFDTPKCIFPLRISAVSGKASQVSIYVLSAEPLLEAFIFDQAVKKLEQRWVEWDKTRPQREKSFRESTQGTGRIQLSYTLEHLAIPGNSKAERDWSKEELLEIANEAYPGYPPSSRGDDFYGDRRELLQYLHVGAPQLKLCSSELPRLAKKDWYVTKQVWQFKPEEMHDLEFQPAIPRLARTMETPFGSAAADVLAHCGQDGIQALVKACQSSSVVERVNAVSVLPASRDERLNSLLPALFKDPEPKVRLRAVETAALAWDPKFLEPLWRFTNETQLEVRAEALACVGEHEPPNRIPYYLELCKSQDLEVQEAALGVLSGIYWHNRTRADPRIAIEPAIELLKSRSARVQGYALHLLRDLNRHQLATADRTRVESAGVAMLSSPDTNVQEAALIFLLEAKEVDAPREVLLPLLGGASIGHIFMALKALNLNLTSYGATHGVNSWPKREPLRKWDSEVKERLSSLEAAPLATNRLALARLIGLKFLQLNGDATAIDLTLPLLKDQNALVRRRAFDVLRFLSAGAILENDAQKWELWWQRNKSKFELVR
jgi:HEAT repeat protein